MDVSSQHHVTMPNIQDNSPERATTKLDNDKLQTSMFKLRDVDKVLRKQMKTLNRSCLPSYASAFKETPRYPDSVELEPRSAKSWKIKPVMKKPIIGSGTTRNVTKWLEQPTSPIFNTINTDKSKEGNLMNFSLGRNLDMEEIR